MAAKKPAIPEISIDKLCHKSMFERHQAEHPEIFRLLKNLALRLKKAGHSRYSMDGLFHVLRFNTAIQQKRLVLNNNWTSQYARLLMAKVPELEGFFEVRKLVSA